MDVRSTEPGVQVYTGKNMAPDLVGKGGVTYKKLASVCLEAQHYPDSPNHVSYKTASFYPDEHRTYLLKTVISLLDLTVFYWRRYMLSMSGVLI